MPKKKTKRDIEKTYTTKQMVAKVKEYWSLLMQSSMSSMNAARKWKRWNSSSRGIFKFNHHP
jgi:hypothetical protein